MEENNNTIIIEFTKQTKVEKEIALPCYAIDKCGIHYYKIISKDKAIQIYDGSSDFGIHTVHSSLAFNFEYDFITEELFNEIYDKVSLRAQKLITEI
jgi:hypothetical protein